MQHMHTNRKEDGSMILGHGKGNIFFVFLSLSIYLSISLGFAHAREHVHVYTLTSAPTQTHTHTHTMERILISKNSCLTYVTNHYDAPIFIQQQLTQQSRKRAKNAPKIQLFANRQKEAQHCARQQHTRDVHKRKGTGHRE
jgi:hypothetical protein